MFALLASALVGCAGAAPELPDAVLGEPTPVAAGGPFARRFADDFGLAGPPSRRRFLLSVTGLTGELAARIPAGPLNLQSDVDDLGRTVWDFEAFDLRLRPDEDPAGRPGEPRTLRLEELIIGSGERALRFVLRVPISPPTLCRPGDPASVEREGLFLVYRGPGTERPAGRGEVVIVRRRAGRQEVRLSRDGDPIPTLRLEMAATFDFEDAVALDPDAPKVSELTLRWILWVGADGPVAFTGRLTGARGPIRVNILEVRARRPS